MPESSLSQHEMEGIIVAFVALILVNAIFLFAASSGAFAGSDSLDTSDFPDWAQQNLVNVVPSMEMPQFGGGPSASGAFAWSDLGYWGDTSSVPPPQTEEAYGDVMMNGENYDVLLINVSSSFPSATADTDTAMAFRYEKVASFEQNETSEDIDEEYENVWMGESVLIYDITGNEEVELIIGGFVEESANISAGETVTFTTPLETEQVDKGEVTLEMDVTRTREGTVEYSYTTYAVQFLDSKALYVVFPADMNGYTVVGDSQFTIDVTGDSTRGDMKWEVNPDSGGGFVGQIVDAIVYIGSMLAFLVYSFVAIITKAILFLVEASVFLLGAGTFLIRGWSVVWGMTSGVHPVVGLLTMTPMIALFGYTFNGIMKLVKALPWT